MERPFSFETFLRIFETLGRDRPTAIDETSFCFRDDPEMTERCLGGRSVRERWEDVTFYSIGGLPVDDWMNMYGPSL